MKVLLFTIMSLICVAWAPGVEAQNVIDEPACFTIYNSAPYTVIGTVYTDYFTRDDGIRTRHQVNFRMATGEREEICSTGPFFPDGTLEIVLRSLFPVFRCRTLADQGEVVIRGEMLADGSARTFADCHTLP